MIANNALLSLNKLVSITRTSTRKRAFKLWLYAHLFTGPKKRKYIYLIHIYFRWLDDFIDNPKNSPLSKKNLINRQRELLQKIISGYVVKLNFTEENCLFYFVEFLMKKNEICMTKYLDNLFKVFEMDISRVENDGIFSESELKEYLTLQNESFFRIFSIFVPRPKSQKEIEGYIGLFPWHVLSLRDFEEDVESGFINICREDINKFNLDVINIMTDSNRFYWLKENYPKILGILEKEISIMNKMPSVIKIAWGLSYIHLNWEFNRLKYYDYKFGVTLKKDLVREFKVMTSTTWLGFQIFVKVFLI